MAGTEYPSLYSANRKVVNVMLRLYLLYAALSSTLPWLPMVRGRAEYLRHHVPKTLCSPAWARALTEQR